jgi:hypothetical protein
MQLTLDISFFQSALNPRSKPSFSREAPYKTDLMVEGNEKLLAVEFVEIIGLANEGDSEQIFGRTIHSDIDYSALNKGGEFFILEGSNIVGRGRVNDVRI